jgi:rSAM/selenodomain-associated transferase 1
MRTIGIFVREPTPGQTKTRLAKAIGDDAAAALARAFAEDICARLALESSLQLFVVGDAKSPWFTSLSSRTPKLQRDAPLGERMRHALDALAHGEEARVLLGSDAPTLQASSLHELFGALEEGADVALIPARDGGYVAIGVRARINAGFLEDASIRYSTEHACEDTARAARSAGLSVALLSPWYDVDVEDDLRVLKDELSAHPERAPRTYSLLSEGGGGSTLARKGSGGVNSPQR